MKNFTIDPQYLSSVTIENVTPLYDKNNFTEQELIKVLKNKGSIKSIQTIDHPKFTELRDQLESLGYIKTKRNYWNGDVVVKSFQLNGVTFRVNDSFHCASALSFRMPKT